MPKAPARNPAPPAPPLCERCGLAPRFGRIRFCKACKKSVLCELASSGYLQPLPRPHRFRPRSAWEDVAETNGTYLARRRVHDRRRRPSPDARVIP